jgi:hypothetical protein
MRTTGIDFDGAYEDSGPVILESGERKRQQLWLLWLKRNQGIDILYRLTFVDPAKMA